MGNINKKRLSISNQEKKVGKKGAKNLWNKIPRQSRSGSSILYEKRYELTSSSENSNLPNITHPSWINKKVFLF